jgi:hypothetical protein
MNAPCAGLALQRPQWGNHRLWSLWDMMTFKAGKLYELAQRVQGLKEYADEKAGQSSYQTSDGATVLPPIDDASVLRIFQNDCAGLDALCEFLGAEITQCEVVRLKDALLSRYKPTYDDVLRAFTDIDKRLKDELGRIVFLSLTAEDKKYFEPKSPLFGQDFAEKYKTDGLFEVDEAAKCRALGRPTASVFHLMRVMEVGIRAVARCLDIPDPIKPAERNWGVILRTIKEGIERKWPNAADRMRGDGALFEDIHASLDAVKNPWRNPTMHVEKKYTDDEAEHIFVAVKGFMMKLASRMDEDGLPLV